MLSSSLGGGRKHRVVFAMCPECLFGPSEVGNAVPRNQANGELVTGIVLMLESERLIILQGPVGSGKSSAVSRALELVNDPSMVRIVTHAEDRHIDYAALEGVLDDPGNPHASILRASAGTGSTVPCWVIDDFHFLDDASAALICWAVESGALRLLASITHIDASPDLTLMLETVPARKLSTTPLDVHAVRAVLKEEWLRPVAQWEAVLATRFTAGNVSAVVALAGFTAENFPSGATPDTWVEHLYAPDIATYGPVIEHVEEIRQSLEPAAWAGLQLVAAAGRLSPQQANRLLGRPVLGTLREFGLIMLDPGTSETRAASGLLDLGIRMNMGRDELHGLWESALGTVALASGRRSPSSHLSWWRANGIELSAGQLLDGARQALQQGQPAPALALLEGLDQSSHRWMQAEAHVLAGRGREAAAMAGAALLDPATPERLGSNEALVAVGSGLWPQAAGHFTDVGGLPEMAELIYAAVVGDHDRVLEIGGQSRTGHDPQIRQCTQVLHAATLALTGAAELGLAVLADLSPQSPSWSGITTQNATDARCAVHLLNGDWEILEELTDEGPTLYWAAERSGLSMDLRTLMGMTTAALPRTLDPAVPAPVGYHLLRVLAREVVDAAADPTGALRGVRLMLLEEAKRLPAGVELLARGWELKLVLDSGTRPSSALLQRIIELAGDCQGKLSHFLLLTSTGLLKHDAPRLLAAAAFGERLGMGAWLCVPIPSKEPHPLLSRRETEIADRAVAGDIARTIAEDLDLSVRTVEKHLANIYRKLGISGREELARRHDMTAGLP